MARPNIADIVERQVRFWDVRERARAKGGGSRGDAIAQLAEGPWISISKQWGSGAEIVARTLAGDLGWQSFDREILTAIAEHSESLETIVSRLDEHAVGSINDYLAQMAVPNDRGQASYLKEMVRVVSGLARKGHAILVGRGANFFLDARYGLRVRLVAPLEARARRVARNDEIELHAAKATIARHDGEQAAFVRQVFLREIDDPVHYDLVLNTESLGPAAAAATIRSALHHKLELPADSD